MSRVEGMELSAALWSSALISPIMMVIDLTLHRRHQLPNTHTTYRHVFRSLAIREIPILRPYLTMTSVYFFTFATANLTDATPLQLPLTTAVNVTAMAYKDRIYSALWSTTTLAPRLPLLSRLLSTAGAMCTVYAQFHQRKHVEGYLMHWGFSPSVALGCASVTVSVAAQWISTPFHLLSMDLYRFPTVSITDRIRRITLAYPSVAAGRMLRILPAFGAGGVLNEQWRGKIQTTK